MAESNGDNELHDTLLLSLVPGVGPQTRRALLERFGTVAAVLDASTSDLAQTSGVGRKLAERIAAARRELDASEACRLAAQHNITMLAESDPRYPALLREIYSPPQLLYVRGQLLPQDAVAIAIVGSRHATQYGLAQAERLAGALARAGLTIVSGLARGVDAAAHRGALAAGGRTIAVLGGGVLNIYPPEHRGLADEVLQAGALISEAPLESAPHTGSFPSRNRIISGMSLGVVVVEASKTSGSLITARLAMEQGREVYAVPGRVDSRNSQGCHRLIRDGAKLVETPDDVLEELGPLVAPVAQPDGREIRAPAELLLNEQERRVLDCVDTQGVDVDAIVAATGLQTSQILATLSVLEVRRLIRRTSGSKVARRG
ncbi:MAG: DNA-protecting protein DprA [Planctomycetes bacterium]|nr:DNA-protecting protein DprA [Planctomycetota bacterium]